jgi:hypothetical protein
LALSKAPPTPARRRAMLHRLGYTEKESLFFSQAADDDINGAFFTEVAAATVEELDRVFEGCRTTTPGAAAEASDLDADGIQALGSALQLQTDPHILYLLHRLGCTTGPWLAPIDVLAVGCMTLLITKGADLSRVAQELAVEYDGLAIADSRFQAFYRFLFDFVKAPAARSIAIDTANTVWAAVMSPKWAGGEAWCEYAHTSTKPVFRDLWVQLGNFAASVSWPTCPEADDDTSWPSLIDGFVDFSRHPPKPSTI